MPRIRSPERELARELWEASGKKRLLKDIAAEIGCSETQVRKWKSQDKWEKGTLPKKNSNVTKKRGGQLGNKNTTGHGAPKENKNAEKHGFFSKYLPEETLSIMQELEEKPSIDILWEQIMLQYTAIIRAQRIMYVVDKADMSKEVSMTSVEATAYDVQQAWDKQAKFLQAQSRAMQTLNALIKQYEEMLHSVDDAEERQLRIDKLRGETERIKAETERLKADKANGAGSVIFAGEGDLVD